jgi:hypothetical protein
MNPITKICNKDKCPNMSKVIKGRDLAEEVDYSYEEVSINIQVEERSLFGVKKGKAIKYALEFDNSNHC